MATPSLAMVPSGKKEGVLYSAIPNTSVGDFTVERGSNATFVNSNGLIQSTNVIGGELVLNGDFSQEGSELVTNGSFSADSDWNKSGWIIENGKALLSSSGVNNLYQGNVTSVGKTFKVVIDTTISAGSVVVMLGGGSGGYNIIGEATTNGTFTYYGVSNGADNRILLQSGSGSTIGSVSIDNVSVKEVGQNWDIANNVGSSTTISDGSLNIVTDGVYTQAEQSNILTSGKDYVLNYTVTSSSGVGSLAIVRGSSSSIVPKTVGTHTFYFESDGGRFAFKRSGGAIDISIDNVSVKEVTEATNTPRIDYTDGGCPVLLTEPQRTNEVSHSSDFSDASWQNTNSSVLGGFTSPDGGSNAYKLVENTANNEHRMGLGISVTDGNSYTFSVFIKKAENDWFRMAIFGKTNTRVYFDLVNGTVGTSQNLVLNPFIESYSNDWYRIGFTYAATATESIVPSLFLAQQDNEPSYLGDGVSGTYIYGGQVEEGSYATSLIPTTGSPYTRLGEVVKGAGDASTFNDSEGVLFFEASSLSVNSDVNRSLRISNSNGYSDYLEIRFRNVGTEVLFLSETGDVQQLNYNTPNLDNIRDLNKFAIKYKENDFAVWINGVEIYSDNAILTPIGLNTLDIATFYGKTSQIQVFNTALTDAELADLTYPVTYDSFNEMANALNLTII